MIGAFFFVVAFAILGLIWATGPLGRRVGYGLIAATILTDVAAWGAAKLFAASVRRDEIAADVRAVLLREADFLGSPPYDPAHNPVRYLALLEGGYLDRFYYRPIADDEIRTDHWFRAKTTYEVSRTPDRTCQRPDRFLFGFGRRMVCLKYRSTDGQPAAVRAVPLAYAGPLSWPVQTVTYSAITAPDGRIRARACVTYRGGVWHWLGDHFFSRWTANGPRREPTRTTYKRTCDGGSGPYDNLQPLFS